MNSSVSSGKSSNAAGRVPVRIFPCRKISSRDRIRSPHVLGMVPDRRLLDRNNRRREVSRSIEVGSVPGVGID